MLDFMMVSEKEIKKGAIEVYPKFKVKKSHDLMIRGGDFYAIWDDENGIWSTDEDDVTTIIDRELSDYMRIHHSGEDCYVRYMWDADSGSIDRFHKYCQKQSRDNFHNLDEKLVFSNDPVRKEDYASKRLTYPLEEGDCPAWDKLVGTLYSPEERHKIEWSIGAVVNGDSRTIQKFCVFYGSAGTGKSTIMNVIQDLFDGYYSVFDARALGSANNAFALEAFKSNPLVAIQHDGDLSKIEDNTRINSLVSHEKMSVNEKFKSSYESRFHAFLFMGTNKPVRITDAKSGLIRRLIDIVPSGEKLPRKEYNQCVKQMKFELGAIAWKCREVYEADRYYYDSYIPINMLGSTNDFFNFVEDNYTTFASMKDVTLKTAWEQYKTYCDEARVPYPYPMRNFKEELKNYFDDFKERYTDESGKRIRNLYIGFKADKFENPEPEKSPDGNLDKTWIELKEQDSIFDKEMYDCPAQLATEDEIPKYKWDKVKTKLRNIDTSLVHYVKVPEQHIVIDFDIKNEKGEKDLALNMASASHWPATYCEVSKGGRGLHLHYIYSGDISALSRMYDDNIEVKVFTGNSSLRRKLSICNNLPIAILSSGLPLKEVKKVIDKDMAITEKGLRTTIIKCLRKEVHPEGTKPNMDMIKHVLDEAHESGVHYDLSDLEGDIIAFAAGSSNQSEYCLKLVDELYLKSDDLDESVTIGDKPIAFYDCEVFPNLFLVNYKVEGAGKPVIRLVNPGPADMERLMEFKLVGFNCRDYDNHMIYGCWMGYTPAQLYLLSQSIINGDKEEKKQAKFGNAYNLSYTDIYDFASAGNKQSLKKWEIQMRKEANDPHFKMSDELREMIKHIRHHELGLPWDKPVPEELWDKVAEYCDDDVLATEALFYRLEADWTARQILADLAEMTVNDTTNSLTTRIIFGRNKEPQSQFHYRNLAEPVYSLDEETYSFLAETAPTMMEQTHGEAGSLLPYFPGYTYDKFKNKSTYRDEEFGEGGYVYSEPGIWYNVALLDIASMHPSSTLAECLFGVEFTRAYRDIVWGRVNIKHEAWDKVNNMLNGKLTKWIQKVIDGELKAKQLANALKTAINSVYGLTSAKFPNPFKHPENVDNIVAKRGELFMIDLKHEVQARGFTVAHIKTDSIKIPNATPEIIKFVQDFGKKYGYNFEFEAVYEKMCLIDKAQYVARFATKEKCEELYGYSPDENNDEGGTWTVTGAAFAHPYVFKSLFTHEPIVMDDMCEVNSVKTAIYLDKNEEFPDVTSWEKLKGLRETYRRGGELSKKAHETLSEYENMTDKDIDDEIAKGHNYIFVGKVGEFTPISPGNGGAILVAQRDDKYVAVNGSKGYRWLESDMVKDLSKEVDIDKSYYRALVDTALENINEFGDAEAFIA